MHNKECGHFKQLQLLLDTWKVSLVICSNVFPLQVQYNYSYKYGHFWYLKKNKDENNHNAKFKSKKMVVQIQKPISGITVAPINV